MCDIAFHLPTRGPRVGPRRCFDFSGRESTPEAKREKRVGGSGARVGSSPTYKLPLANGSLPTPEARVGSWSLAAASAERFKLSWAWVLG